MRKELYKAICERLEKLCVTPDGWHMVVEPGQEIPEGWERLIKHIDLWNHNVEFIEQEENWERPAVFVEFKPIQWNAIKNGVEYRAEAVVDLHVVTDWQGSASIDSPFREESLKVFDILDAIHTLLVDMSGETFAEFDLVGSSTSHNHDELLENVESYQCVGIRSL